MSVSDVICQSMEVHVATDLVERKGEDVNLQDGCPVNIHRCGNPAATKDKRTTINPPELFHQDWSRTQQVATTGFIFTGPIAHVWYQILEAVVTTRHRMLGLVARLLLDALVFSPIAVAGYFTVRTVLECTSSENDKYDMNAVARKLTQKLSLKYRDAVEASWKFWPAVNVVNFSIIPVPFRVLYNNGLSIFWNTYLTHLNGKRLEQVVEARESIPDFPKGYVVEEPCSCCHCRAVRG